MATKIRLQRHGKKGKPFYHIVIADSRSKRDGRYIEKVGSYNPNTNPATIDLDFDTALNWLQTGAEMTDTARALLSYKGVLYKNHLINGVKKGALTEEQVEKRFAKWLAEKEAKVSAKKDGLSKTEAKAKADKLKAEAEVSSARAKEIEAKNTPVEEAPVEEAPVAEGETAEVTEEAAPATEEPVAEEAAAPVVEEAPAEEEVKAEETPAEAPVTEEPVAEEAAAPEVEEAPVAEAKAEETPAEAPADEEPKAE